MDTVRRSLVLGVFFVVCTSALLAGQGVPPVATPRPTQEEMEAFLLKAKISNRRDAGSGVTGSSRITLSDGRLTHDAHLQAVDIARAVFQAGKASEVNFKDTYRYNIAGYRLARLIGLDIVPMSVERNVEGKMAAVTWWLDDVMMDEGARVKKKVTSPDPQRFGKQIQVMKIWDELIQNKDRNGGNLIWTSDWSMWLIDHTRAFRVGKELVAPKRPDTLRSSLARRHARADRGIAREGGGRFSDER